MKIGRKRLPKPWLRLVLAAGLGLAAAAPVTQTIEREENRTQEIGGQTVEISQELEAIVEDLQLNRLLAGSESADFQAARDGMDAIARQEIQAVLDRLVAARQALERAQLESQLHATVKAQERLIGRLTEELVRIQYRSQLRHLLEEMRTIVQEQRQAVRATQNAALEIAATNSEDLRRDIRDQVMQAQDGIWNDWSLVRGQVNLMVERYSALPFADVLQGFRTRAQALPIEPRLAETRGHLRGDRFGLAVAGQRELSVHFLALLKILQSAGLSSSEERAALEDLIEKTEQALRDQQDLHLKTETLGRDMTEPLREELARAEDQLANFVRDLAGEAEQMARDQQASAAPSETPAGQPAAAPEQPAADPGAQAPQEAENPWADAQAETSPSAQTPAPDNPWADAPADAPDAPPAAADATPASELSQASRSMNDAADRLTQNRPENAAGAQQQAIDHLAQALSQLREQLDQSQRLDQINELNQMMAANDMLGEIGALIREQQDLIGQTQKTTAEAAGPPEPPDAAADNQNATSNTAEGAPAPPTPDQGAPPEAPAGEAAQAPAPNQPAQGANEPPPDAEAAAAAEPPAAEPPAEPPATPLELGRNQQDLGDRTQAFSEKVATTPAAEPVGEATREMREAASRLGRSQPGEALPHQNEALDALRTAERQLAEALAEMFNAQEAQDWLEQMGNLDDVIKQIQQMADEAAAMQPAPAPQMASEAQDIAQNLSSMAGQPPMDPQMAAQMQSGSQMMQDASGQLQQGQTPQASQTMNQAAAQLSALRQQMAGQMSASLQQAMAAMQARQAGQAASSQQLANAAGRMPSNQPATRPSQNSRGQGMRGEGPTNFEAERSPEIDLESGAWSRLPEGEREEILQSLKEKYPARYERALIRYYRNLSRLEAEP